MGREEHVIVVIQARSGSSRLPGKHAIPLRGVAVLRRVYDSCVRVAGTYTLVVGHEQDETLKHWCDANNIPAMLAPVSEDDVLGRYIHILDTFRGTIIRITGDCPCLCPELVMGGLDWFNHYHYDYVGVCHNSRVQCGFPDGWDFEVLSPKMLRWLDAESNTADREHVTLHLHTHLKEAGAAGLKYRHIKSPIHLPIKASVDTTADIASIEKIMCEDEHERENLAGESGGVDIPDLSDILEE